MTIERSDLWDRYSRLRSDEKVDAWQFIADSYAQGLSIVPVEARRILEQGREFLVGIAPPDYLVTFIAEVLMAAGVQMICDPWARPLGILPAVLDRMPNVTGAGVATPIRITNWPALCTPSTASSGSFGKPWPILQP